MQTLIIALLGIIIVISIIACFGMWIAFSKLMYIENVMKELQESARQETIEETKQQDKSIIIFVSPN